MSAPQVSVLMPVHNGMQYLEVAVRSVLAQDFDDFELVVVDDGSTDGSTELARSFGDTRVRVVSAGRVGLVAALNLGLRQAEGKLIARMDSDDVARSDRFGAQVTYLNAHDQVGVVSSDVRLIGADGAVIGRHCTRWASSRHLRQGLLYQRRMRPLIHPSVMVRRAVLEAVNGYRDFRGAEDIDLWLRALDVCEFRNLPETLLDYRMHAGGVSREPGSQQEVSGIMAAANWLIKEHVGADVFTEAPELFALLRERVGQRLETEVLPTAADYRRARGALRDGRVLGAVAQIAKGSLRHHTLLRPDVARAASSQIIVDTVAQAVDVMAEGGDPWTS